MVSWFQRVLESMTIMVESMAAGRQAWCWSSNEDLIAEREEGGKEWREGGRESGGGGDGALTGMGF